MNASKEEAKKARQSLIEIARHVPIGVCTHALEHIKDFLEAAEKKLPSEKAFERERLRRRQSPVMLYHEPSHAHPASCAGCNTDASLWGKPVKKGGEVNGQ